MVPVFTLSGDAFLKPTNLFSVDTTLYTSKPFSTDFQFSGVFNLLACGQRQQMFEARVDSDTAFGLVRNPSRLGVNEQTQIPATSTPDDAGALNLACGDSLSMELQGTHTK